MNLLKKIAIAGATFSLALGTYALPVLGAADASNENISGDSFADSEALDNDNVTVNSNNLNSELDNIDVALANTGLNSQNGGEDGNTLSASNAQAEYETGNFLNVNEAMGQDGASATNENISGGSDGDATAVSNADVTVKNLNKDTDVLNVTASVANTGLNFQNDNEDGNSTMTGTAWSYASASNVVNHNQVSNGGCGLPVCGQSDPTAMASNTNITGDSFADSTATNTTNMTVNNTNDGTDFVNVTASVANSGLNFQSNNEDGNSITTGNTASGVAAANYVNVNETAVGNGAATATNSNITAGSDGDATATNTTTLTVNNTNKDTDVLNVSVSVANSGGNVQNGNEDGNTTTTGSAVSGGTTTNVVNANTVSW